MVSNAFIRIVNESNDNRIRYVLGEDFSFETAVIVGNLYCHNSEWKFTVVGSGYQGGISALCNDFGLQVG